MTPWNKTNSKLESLLIFKPESKKCRQQTKGPVTQAPITRTKTRTIQMHGRDWLNCSTQNTPTLNQPIEGVHFYRYRCRSRGLCDRALRRYIRKRRYMYYHCLFVCFDFVCDLIWFCCFILLYYVKTNGPIIPKRNLNEFWHMSVSKCKTCKSCRIFPIQGIEFQLFVHEWWT